MKHRTTLFITLGLVAAIVGIGLLLSRYLWLPPARRSNATHTVHRAEFSSDYRKAASGQIRVIIPEVYELFNVALALTETSQNNPYRYACHDTPYYDEVMNHYQPYADHPVVTEIDSSLNRFPSHRALFAYTFDEDKIVPGPYAGTWRDSVFEDYLPLLEEFAAESNFRQFYNEHRSYYEEQIALYEEAVPLRRIWNWLETEFPRRYDRHTVVISPLVSGTHNTFCYKDAGDPDYWATVMFVSAPARMMLPGVSAEVIDAFLTRYVFTEIDHNYVNPVTDNQEYLQRIDRAMRDFENWNTGGGYRTPAETFNEYMTWTAFSLFAKDHYEDDVFAEVNASTVEFMEQYRGFPRFGEFDAALLESTRNAGRA